MVTDVMVQNPTGKPSNNALGFYAASKLKKTWIFQYFYTSTSE